MAKIDTKTTTISEHSLESSTSAKNRSVTFDSEQGMNLLVNNITRSFFYQLRQLRSIRRSLSTDAAKTLVHSLISSRVDYCNSIFYGATNIVVRRLQSVLNAAARLISNKRKFDHITPRLRDQLHWLPISQRIDSRSQSSFTTPVASPRGEWRGPDPPTSVQTPLGISANPLKSVFLHIGGGGGTPCMYIVTFTAHQQRNMVRTPPLFWGWRCHCTTPSMAKVRHTSAAPAILSGRSAPGFTYILLF